MKSKLLLLAIVPLLLNCNNHTTSQQMIQSTASTYNTLLTGAEQTDRYIPLLNNKKVAMVVNQTSIIGGNHSVDSLLKSGVNIVKVFAPEHGFRGKADAGEKVKDDKDVATGLPIVSLYGKNRKPSPSQLENVDVVVFDIQDVGVRFYTYISTMTYVMEACAENNVPMIILDRPNPNGHYVDGPVLEPQFKSFVGMHPIPIVHGLTVGELAQMINGEKWLKNEVKCDLKVISCANYTHQTYYPLPVKPSPNLPNIRAVLLYPSLALFEGTAFSVGRGTEKQFQVLGHPDFEKGAYYFTPEPRLGAKYPKLEGENCRGINFTSHSPQELFQEKKLRIDYLIDAYKHFPDKDAFFNANNFFEKLAGTAQLRQQIKDGLSEENIRNSWEPALNNYKKLRKKYLIYE